MNRFRLQSNSMLFASTSIQSLIILVAEDHIKLHGKTYFGFPMRHGGRVATDILQLIHTPYIKHPRKVEGPLSLLHIPTPSPSSLTL